MGEVDSRSRWMIKDARAVDVGRPCVVCILNCTPDSFSDGGELASVQDAIDRARRAVDQGADMLDIGGESTRPGAARVDAKEQVARVVPVIRAIRDAGLTVPISVDTTRATVADQALRAGADVINDVSGLAEDPEMASVIAQAHCGVVLMHRLVSPERDRYSDQYTKAPAYGDVVSVVRDALERSLDRAVLAGVPRACVALDPGLGFGKGVEDNAALILGTQSLRSLGCPVYSGISRKSFVGRLALGRDSEPKERDAASVGMSVVHLMHGASVFRVHDVEAHRSALDAAYALLNARA